MERGEEQREERNRERSGSFSLIRLCPWGSDNA
jgi:hypothetical protein